MTINPFENPMTYSSYVLGQIENLSINESKHIDIRGNTVESFRATVSTIGKKNAKRFSVKVALDGGVWVKRIS